MLNIDGRFVLKTDARYRVRVPGTDITFVISWTGKVRQTDDGEEFLFVFDDGREIVVDAVLLEDLTEIDPNNN